MPELLVATRNEGKVREFRAFLEPLAIRVLSAREAGLGAGPEETGTSYEENALLKAAQAAHQTGVPALADDSGLEVDALGGAPGIYSARFGGELSDGERIAYLLERLKRVPDGDRKAAFVAVLVLALPDGRVESFAGRCEGVILQGPRGEGGHGYDPIFWSPELGKTFAQADEVEKSTVSHRGRALTSFAGWLENNRALLERDVDDRGTGGSTRP